MKRSGERDAAGRSINLITKTNWEGVGVTPDIDITANLAPLTAHLMALTGLRDHAGNEQTKETLNRLIERIQAELNRMKR